MSVTMNEESSAAEVFSNYFKKSQSVTGVLNPNIFWQLYNEAAEEEEDESEADSPQA